jgi:hypothetical protein
MFEKGRAPGEGLGLGLGLGLGRAAGIGRVDFSERVSFDSRVAGRREVLKPLTRRSRQIVNPLRFTIDDIKLFGGMKEAY